jgi:DNA-binding response OmpR family regulator
MTVLTFVARFDLHRRVEKALSSQFVMDDVASAKECLQVAQLARYEGVLIDSDSLIFVDVPALVKLLRHESFDTSIFVFSRYLDLEQRLCLFEAGVDDCVCEPFFASEMAVRLGLSIRLRQAASDLGASGTANVLRSGAGSGATNSGAIGKGDRSAPERISAAARLSPPRLRQQATPTPSAFIGKGRSRRQ